MSHADHDYVTQTNLEVTWNKEIPHKANYDKQRLKFNKKSDDLRFDSNTAKANYKLPSHDIQPISAHFLSNQRKPRHAASPSSNGIPENIVSMIKRSQTNEEIKGPPDDDREVSEYVSLPLSRSDESPTRADEYYAQGDCFGPTDASFNMRLPNNNFTETDSAFTAESTMRQGAEFIEDSSTSVGGGQTNVRLVNAVVISNPKLSSAQSQNPLTPNEFACFLKSCKVALKSVRNSEPLPTRQYKRNLYSSTRWQYVPNSSKSKPFNRLKWHQTDFNGKTLKPKKVQARQTLPYATPLANAWLDLAKRDLADAETLQAIRTENISSPILRHDDPCLPNTVNCDEVELSFDLNSFKINEANQSCKLNARKKHRKANNRLTSRKKEESADEVDHLPHDRSLRCYALPRSDVTQSNSFEQERDLLCDVTKQEKLDIFPAVAKETTKMQSGMRIEDIRQPVLCNAPTNNEDHISDIFNDWLDESPKLLNEYGDLNIDIIDGFMDGDFPLVVDINETTYHKPAEQRTSLMRSSVQSMTQQHSDVLMTSVAPIPPNSFPSLLQSPALMQGTRTTSMENGGFGHDERASDTDSGIYSPGIIKSPFGESPMSDVDNTDCEAFFNCSLRPPRVAVPNEVVDHLSCHGNGQEPHLLDLDHQNPFEIQTPNPTYPSNSSPNTCIYNACAQNPRLDQSFPTTCTLSQSKSSKETSSKEICSPCPRPDISRKRSLKRNSTRNSRKTSDKAKSVHLWEFIRDILLESKHCPSLIKWEDRQSGVFRFVQSDTVAAMWGKKKQNPKMTYEKLSRAMRYYYNRGILERVDGRRLVYKFGPNAHGWRVKEDDVTDSGQESRLQPRDSESKSPLREPSMSPPPSHFLNTPTENLDTYSRSTSSFCSISLPSANVLLEKSIKLAIS